MASSVIMRLSLLLMLYGCIAAGKNAEDPTVSSLHVSRGGCEYCCSRIDVQIAILNRIYNATDKLARDVGEIKTSVVEDIPSQLKQHSVELDALKTSVGTDIPSELENQLSEQKRIKTSADAITIGLNKHSEDLLVHDAQLNEQGLLLEKLNSLIQGKNSN